MKSKWPSMIHLPIQTNTLSDQLYNHTQTYQFQIFANYGGLYLRPRGLCSKYPFIHPMSFSPEEEFSEKLKWQFNLYDIAVEFPIANMPLIISRIVQGEEQFKYLRYLFSQSKPLGAWRYIFKEQFKACRPDPELLIVILFYEPWVFTLPNHTIGKKAVDVGVTSYQPQLVAKKNFKTLSCKISIHSRDYREFQRIFYRDNRTIPQEIWLAEIDDVS